MEDIIATSGIYSVLDDNSIKVIGYKVDFNSDEQKIRFVGMGCIVPEIIVFHYGTEQLDHFYFEDNIMVYQAVSIRTTAYTYLGEIYNECALKKSSPKDFIEKIQEAYTIKTLGF